MNFFSNINESTLNELELESKLQISRSSEKGRRTSESSGSYTVSSSAARITFNNSRSSRISSDAESSTRQKTEIISARHDRKKNNRNNNGGLKIGENRAYSDRIKIGLPLANTNPGMFYRKVKFKQYLTKSALRRN